MTYHRKYERLVRLGPNHVSISNFEFRSYNPCLRDQQPLQQERFLYSFRCKKQEWDCIATTFSGRDRNKLKSLKRPVAGAFSMSNLLELEPMADRCIEILEQKMKVKEGQEIDFGQWLHWYAFKVITSLTFSDCMGFMEQEKDINGIISALESRLAYNCVIGQVPILHSFLLGYWFSAFIASRLPGIPHLDSTKYVIRFAMKQLERYVSKDQATGSLRDLLAHFKRFRNK